MTTSHLQLQRLPRLFWAVLFVGAGVALLLDPFFDPITISAVRVWPLLLIVIGLAKMTGAWPGRHHGGGSGLALLGGWLLLNTLSDWAYRDTWPVLVVFAGIRMIWTSLGARRALFGRTESVHVD